MHLEIVSAKWQPSCPGVTQAGPGGDELNENVRYAPVGLNDHDM